MCGIVGFVNLDGAPADKGLAECMSLAIRRRGPDGNGSFASGACALGHARLAIIDLTDNACQPMRSQDGRYCLVYNGEVYNFRELRRELEGLGCRFRSSGDTEVVLWAHAVWGEKALDRFNGMFAYAVWDSVDSSLFLARDRYGMKPLYLSAMGGVFAFASEIKGVLAHPRFSVDINHEALLEYFTFQNLFSDRSLFKDVTMFPAGCWMRLRPGQASWKPQRYWDFDFREPDHPGDEREYEEELNRLFVQAVERQLVSDVEVGAFLSSGMDSGSIAAVAKQHNPDLRTFTCGYDMRAASPQERNFDERSRAAKLAAWLGSRHQEIRLAPGDVERSVEPLVWMMDEPRVGQSYPNYYACLLASRSVKVVLSGAGGDEVFGGYPWRYYRAVSNDSFEDYIDKYYRFWQRLIPNQTIKKFFAPVWDKVSHVWTRDIFRQVFDRHASELTRPEDYINHSLYLESKTFLHGLLVMEDKLSMGFGLECRAPFLDNDLVDFAMRLPVRLKLGNLDSVLRLNENDIGPKSERYFQKTRDGKLLLRRAMERRIPRNVTNGVKQGFSGPDATWFRRDIASYVHRRLLNPKANIYAFFDPETVRRLVLEHLDGRENRRLLLWSLLCFESWCRQFLGMHGAEENTHEPCEQHLLPAAAPNSPLQPDQLRSRQRA